MIAAWDKSVAELEIYEGSVIMQTKDEDVVMWKIGAAMNDTITKDLGQATLSMLDGWLDSRSGLPCPGLHDLRHDDMEKQKERHGANDVGVFHLGCWIPDQGNPRGPIMSADTVAGSYLHRVVAEYESQLQKLYRQVYNIMRLLTPGAYAQYQQQAARLAKDHADYRAFRQSTLRLHLALAVVRNLRVLPHVDSQDSEDGLVIMTNLGTAAGASLVIGTLGHQFKLKYQPGDVVLLNSFLLVHAITPFQCHSEGHYGTRTALVLFNHKDAVDYPAPPPLSYSALGKDFRRYPNVGGMFEQKFL